MSVRSFSKWLWWRIRGRPDTFKPYTEDMTLEPGESTGVEIDLSQIITDPALRASIQRGEHKLEARQMEEVHCGDHVESQVMLVLDGDPIAKVTMGYTWDGIENSTGATPSLLRTDGFSVGRSGEAK